MTEKREDLVHDLFFLHDVIGYPFVMSLDFCFRNKLKPDVWGFIKDAAWKGLPIDKIQDIVVSAFRDVFGENLAEEIRKTFYTKIFFNMIEETMKESPNYIKTE